MLKFCYYSQEVYTFENEDNLIKSFSFDDFQPGKLDPLNHTVTYNINHNRCIRLSDLIFYIEIDFVRIHLGQLLQLIQSLLEKVEYIQSQGLEHEFLDMNRIWLYFKEQGQYPGLIYQFLDYSIHFTGYSCPLHINNKFAQKASIQIKQIICQIIDKCDHKIKIMQKKNKDQNNSICKEIFKLIKDLCKSNSSSKAIISFLKDTIDLYTVEKQNKNNLGQFLNLDDTDIEPERQKAIDKVNYWIKQIIEIGDPYGQVCIEFLLQHAIPIITQNLKTFQFDKQNYEKEVQSKSKELKDKELELQKLVEVQVKEQIILSLQEYQKDYKFDISEEETIQLQCYIVNSIFQSPEVRHYHNTYWFQKDDQINNYIVAAISKIQQKVIKDELESTFMYKILLLIDDLI